MFEDSTFESAGSIRTRSRGWMLATFTFNGAALLALALFPLLHPEALPRMVNSILMTAPPPRQEPPPPPREMSPRQASASPMTVPRLIVPSVFPRIPYAPRVPEPPQVSPLANWNMDSRASGNGLGIFRGHGAEPSVCPEPQEKARVSGGVMDGYLKGKVIPQYPPIAREMGIEGTVILQASISKTGTIENLRVVSGPELLRRAAIDAVSQWRYRPYLLNGDPVEVETTVNVQFTLH